MKGPTPKASSSSVVANGSKVGTSKGNSKGKGKGIKMMGKGVDDKDKDVDLSQLSAFAVYNNLIPGVKAYQDTNQGTESSKRKKNRKKLKKEKVKEQEEQEKQNGVPRNEGKQNGTKRKQPSSSGNSSSANGSSEPPAKKRITPIAFPTPNQGKKDRGTKEVPTLSRNQSKKKDAAAAPTTTVPSEVEGKKKKKRNKKKKGNQNHETGQQLKDRQASSAKKIPKTTELEEGDDESADSESELPKFLPNPLAKVSGAAKGSKKKAEDKTNKKSKEIGKGNKETKNSKGNDMQVVATKLKKNKKNAVENDEDQDTCQEAPDLRSLLTSKVVQDSEEYGRRLFEWLIHPQTLSDFMDNYWEKQALLVKRAEVFPDYFEWIMSSSKLDDILRKNVLKYTKNIDVVSYENGERVTISKDMNHRVRPAALWDYYAVGNSIRLLNPQTYCPPLRKLNASLQEMFGTFVGANVYLTPADAQGFAPHYDDIEAFVLQIEGKKHWKLYKPRNPNEVLPRFSSHDFGKEEETLGKPFIDTVLEPGDLLYFPRGVIHQAKTVEGHHSMHITISCYQQNSWVDLLKEHFTRTVDELAANDVEFRKGLPLNYLSYMGLAPSKKVDAETTGKRKEFKTQLKRLINKVGGVDADNAADQMGKKFMWDALPPYLTRKEAERTVQEDGEFLNNGKVKNRTELEPDTMVKLVRKHCARLVREEGVLRLYFSLENALVYHEEEAHYIEIPEEYEQAVEQLINAYPQFTKVEELEMENDDLEKKIEIATELWEYGILITEKPLEANEIDEEDFDFDMDESDTNSDMSEENSGNGSDEDEEDSEADDIANLFDNGAEDDENEYDEMDDFINFGFAHGEDSDEEDEEESYEEDDDDDSDTTGVRIEEID